jgi:hypothetical protein
MAIKVHAGFRSSAPVGECVTKSIEFQLVYYHHLLMLCLRRVLYVYDYK